MHLKYSWIPFILSIITIVPFKIYSDISGVGWSSSIIFSIFTIILLVTTALSSLFSQTEMQIIKVKQNIVLGVSALISTFAFILNGVSYIEPLTYDKDQNPLLMCVLSIVSGISFLLISISYFSGKNLFKKAQIMIFPPCVFYCMAMISFLSISSSTADPYDILQKSLLLLFLLYQVQAFISFSNRGAVKNIFTFALPAIVSSAMFNIPNIINGLQEGYTFKYISMSESLIGLSLALYAVLLVIECHMQIIDLGSRKYDPFPEIN